MLIIDIKSHNITKKYYEHYYITSRNIYGQISDNDF
jgi:hypothetical protein